MELNLLIEDHLNKIFIDENIIVSDEIGFDMETFDGWYIELTDIDEEGILKRYWHHSCHDREVVLNGWDDIIIDDCRVITKANFLEIN